MGVFDSVRSQLSRISNRANTLIVKFHRSYIAFACLFALTGYALVLLFPLLAITSVVNIYTAFLENEAINWQLIAIWSAALILSTLFSYRSLQVKLSPPVGLTLAEDKAPEIFKLVQQYQAHFKRPDIQRIVITVNYELDIIKVPKWALPVWSMNTLIIGLPVLLCLSPKQFECLLARRMGQFSKRHNPLINWLYQLRSIWKQYAIAYGKMKHLDCYLLKWLYGFYAALYASITVYAARRDELNADSYAMELFIHDDVREMITADATYQWYLQKRYWPAIDKITTAKTKTPVTPYYGISAAVQANFKEEKLRSLIHSVLKAEPSRKSPIPKLQQRLDNIGHDAPYLSENTGNAAASKYLGDSLNNVIKLIDTLWLKDHITGQKNDKK
ncbi:MAG: hypothetical protein OEY66_11560 [Gammaproteobacteria bacterium]|nr:hypothetical protein [Gammaproteobacteria bacterium]